MRKTLIVATKNADKLAELKKLLRGLPVRLLSLSHFADCPLSPENGKTFEANAGQKARFYSRRTRGLVLSDDSGLEVEALGGKPGVYSARFARQKAGGSSAGHPTYNDNNLKLLRLLKGVPPSRRGARFVAAVALYEDGRKIGVVRGECRGRIAEEEKGKKGFGYDPVFVPRGYKKTYAELRPSEKNRISHRARALKKARRLLSQFLK